jgi:hypothetical protein
VYAVVTSGCKDNFKAMAGCGVNGVIYPAGECEHKIDEVGLYTDSGEDDWRCNECGEVIPEPEFVGVQQESIEFLKKLLLDEIEGMDEDNKKETPHYRMADALSNGLRYNQGDAYFANALGKDVPSTKPGEAETPILEKLL